SAGDDRLTGRIRLLEDSNRDGVFDTSTVFADNLTRPSSVACARGGVFVAGPTQLLFALDQDNNGIADLQRPLVAFQYTSPPEHPHRFPRALCWGPDRRIHLALPGRDAEVSNLTTPNRPAVKVWLGGLSFNPLTMELREEAGGDASGISFDDAGRKFLCTPSTSLAVGMLTGAELWRNPFGPPMPSSAALVPAPQGGAPLDCLIYRGNLYSTNLQGQAFLADPVQRTISLVTLKEGMFHPQGAGPNGPSPVTLVTSRDPSFRPMHLTVGPDDAIYVADLAREVYPGGKPPRADPENPERKASGRIWRLAPMTESIPVNIPPDLTNVVDLATALGSSNSWVRATAARLLLGYHQTNTAPILRSVLTRAKWPVARLEALRSLEACGGTTFRDLAQALADKDPTVRMAAVDLIPQRIQDGRVSDALWASLQHLSSDPSPEVRLRVALVLGSVRFPSPRYLLSAIRARNPGEEWIQRALLTASPENLAGLFIKMIGEPNMEVAQPGHDLLQQLALSIGLAGRRGDVSDCLRAMLDMNLDRDVSYPLVSAFGAGANGRGSTLPDSDEARYWVSIAYAALNVAVSGGDDQLRAEAVKVVAACIGPQFEADDYLLVLFTPRLPLPMQIPVIRALAARGSDRDYEALTQRWHLWEAREQLATLNALLEREAGAEALLRALEDGRIPMNALTSVHINLLRFSSSSEVRARAERMFGSTQPDRGRLLGNFLGALELQGSETRGRDLFAMQCSSCHQANATGVGPAPETMEQKSALHLLAGLLDPSREIAPHHATTILRLRDGRTVWGVADERNPLVIDLRTDAGPQRYLKSAVENMEQTDWSLMPDNIGAGLTRQDIADLLAYLRAP
ncbi:MAG: c-type cytochrome, partial [Verrucomicrobia bacterium]|nr:c-type cytochrome [Verrucomicrobiota bacterium]